MNDIKVTVTGTSQEDNAAIAALIYSGLKNMGIEIVLTGEHREVSDRAALGLTAGDQPVRVTLQTAVEEA